MTYKGTWVHRKDGHEINVLGLTAIGNIINYGVTDGIGKTRYRTIQRDNLERLYKKKDPS